MEVVYAKDVKARLINWKHNDPILYRATERVLLAIQKDPVGFGNPGDPLVQRLSSYAVDGRDAEYVVTWDVVGQQVRIITISSRGELIQRARFGTFSRGG